MANEFIIKEHQMTTVTFSGGKTAATTITNYTPNINGEIIEVDYASNGIGSIYITLSGSQPSTEVFRRNAPSGTNWSAAVPRLLNESTTGSIAGASYIPFYTTTPLAVKCDVGSNAVANISGTSYTVKVKYK